MTNDTDEDTIINIYIVISQDAAGFKELGGSLITILT